MLAVPPRTKVPLCQLAFTRAPMPLRVKPACASMRVARLAAIGARRRAVELIEQRHARADQHIVAKHPGVVERELDRPPFGPRPPPPGGRRRSRRGRRARAGRRPAARPAGCRPRRPARAGHRPAPPRAGARGAPSGLAAPRAAASAWRRSRATRAASIIRCDGLSGSDRLKPQRSCSRFSSAKFTGRLSIRSSVPSASRVKRSGKAASIAAVGDGSEAVWLRIRVRT